MLAVSVCVKKIKKNLTDLQRGEIEFLTTGTKQ